MFSHFNVPINGFFNGKRSVLRCFVSIKEVPNKGSSTVIKQFSTGLTFALSALSADQTHVSKNVHLIPVPLIIELLR